MSTITAGRVALVHYTLHSGDGEQLDTSAGGEPLPYLHGHHNIVPGLERALEDKEVGFSGEIRVAPADGYGDHDGEAPQAVPKDAFPDDFPMEEGMQFVVENERGEHFPVWVAGFADGAVLIDTNHPLAGVELVFTVEVVGVRDATAEELEHGHPHGIDGTGGHHHDH